MVLVKDPVGVVHDINFIRAITLENSQGWSILSDRETWEFKHQQNKEQRILREPSFTELFPTEEDFVNNARDSFISQWNNHQITYQTENILEEQIVKNTGSNNFMLKLFFFVIIPDDSLVAPFDPDGQCRAAVLGGN